MATVQLVDDMNSGSTTSDWYYCKHPDQFEYNYEEDKLKYNITNSEKEKAPNP